MWCVSNNQEAACYCGSVRSSAYLAHGHRQRLDNLLVRHGNNTLAVDLNDPVADANAATLGYAASHQTADLRAEERHFT